MKTFSRLKLRLLPPLGYAVIRLLGATLRLRTLYPERVEGRWGKGKKYHHVASGMAAKS